MAEKTWKEFAADFLILVRERGGDERVIAHTVLLLALTGDGELDEPSKPETIKRLCQELIDLAAERDLILATRNSKEVH